MTYQNCVVTYCDATSRDAFKKRTRVGQAVEFPDVCIRAYGNCWGFVSTGTTE